jgi:hypothetical protein
MMLRFAAGNKRLQMSWWPSGVGYQFFALALSHLLLTGFPGEAERVMIEGTQNNILAS